MNHCPKRRGYATESAASSVLFAIRARDTEAGDRLEVATCSRCGKYHVQRKVQAVRPTPPVAPLMPDNLPRRGRPPSLPYNDD